MYLLELFRTSWPYLLILLSITGLAAALLVPPRSDAKDLAERFIERAREYTRLHPTERGNWNQ